MKIALIGYGRLGKVFAQILSAKGHLVWVGLRGEKQKSEISDLGLICVFTGIGEAIEKAEVVIFATPWKAAIDICSQYQKQLKQKVIIDSTNPLKNDLSGLENVPTGSVALGIQSLLPGAVIFKAFNTLGSGVFLEASRSSEKVSMYYCGNSEEKTVEEIGASLGVQAIKIGSLDFAQALENLAIIWITSAYKLGFGPTHFWTLNK